MAFQIRLHPSDHQFQTNRDTTLLQAALDAELLVPYGCRDGACGKCKAKVLEGRVEHGRSPESTLSIAEREAGSVLMCCAQATSDLVLECRDVRTGGQQIPVRKMPSRILSLDKATDDVMVMRLQLPPGEPFRFLAGQYIDFLLAGGQRRSFSIANGPDLADTLELHIRFIPGGSFTEQVFNRLKVRDILRFEGPLGSFFLRNAPTDTPIVMLAGGTGFAPLKSIIEDMIAQRIERPIRFYWGARNAAGLYMDELAQKWAREIARFEYIPVISDEAPEGWAGRRSLVHHAVMNDLPNLSAHHVYACGAPAMIDAARSDFVARCGLPEQSFFADAFTFSTDSPS